MKFTKMQGIGNDYVYVNCFEEHVENPEELARQISDRHFGVGSDGLILIKPTEQADCEMEMYNADGSKGKMCGNGVRCVGKYVYDAGLTDKTEIDVLTGAGIKHLVLTVENGKVSRVTVDMGSPIFFAPDIPLATDKTEVIDAPIEAAGKTWQMSAVSMGNPHCVIPVEDPMKLDLETIGPDFECHPLFPERVNTEFIKVLDRKTVSMRVWERGSGETMACGTGACAVAAACIRNGWTEDEVTVKLLGGDLLIRWDREQDTIFMTGPACTVFQGEW